MPIAVIMPKFEMTQETGKVAVWVKADGDVVKKGDVILEIETDKVNMEVEAPGDGILMGITARPGEIVPIGQSIAYIVKPGESLPGASSAPATPAAVGAEPLAAARLAGAASPVAVRLAEDLGVDLALIRGTGPRGQVTRQDVEAHAAAQQAAPAAGDGKVAAVPAARRLARELGLDLHQVRGTGPEGRIQPEDVRAFAATDRRPPTDDRRPPTDDRRPMTDDRRPMTADRRPMTDDRRPMTDDRRPPTDDRRPPTDDRRLTTDDRRLPTADRRPPTDDRRSATDDRGQPSTVGGQPSVIRRLVPLTNIRRTIAERMTASVREAPQFTVSLDADMTRALAVVEDLRGGDAAGNQPRVTLTALLIKACAWALCQHPGANAAYQDGQIAEWGEVNVGVATAIEAGLIVPVIRQADQLGMRGIAARLADVTTRARGGQLKIEDLQGGTFTLSNLGMFGIERFTAILNPPQAAILAVGRVAKRPVVLADDRIEGRPMTTLTLTADHRVLDGVTAAQFLATIQRILEHPGLLLE